MCLLCCFGHACRFAVSDLFSIRVTGVRYYLESIHSKCSLCGLSHWLETTAISCIKYYCVRDDQSMFRVYGSLNVICRQSGLTP